MQSLPDIPPARRKVAVERYLAGAAADFVPAERAEIAQKVFAILDTGEFAEVFAPGSRAEVPIVGRIARADGGEVAVAGQVDRLIVSDHAVLIADYKTDTSVPDRLDDIPRSYIAQLAFYRAPLCRIYPDKTVRAALIFTNGPALMEVPETAMDEALCQILTKKP